MTPPWLNLSRISWWELKEDDVVFLPDTSANVSLHTDVTPQPRSILRNDDDNNNSDEKDDLIIVDDVETPYFTISKTTDFVIKKEHAGKKINLRCGYDESDLQLIGKLETYNIKHLTL